MARLGRGFPARLIVTRGRIRRDATIRPATIHITTTFHPPVIIAETPNATIRPATIHITTTFHPPAVKQDATIRPATIHVATRFHPPVIPAPPGARLLEESQLEYNGLLMGAGTVYEWLRVTGLDEPPGITSGNVRRAVGHGSLPGSKTAEERVITYEMQISDSVGVAGLAAVLEQLREATPIDVGEKPLAIRQHGRVWLTRGEVIARPIPPTDHRLLANVHPMVQFVCSDPVLYGPELHRALIAPGSAAAAVNSGNTPTRPKIIIPGPVAGPLLTHLQTGRRFGLNLTIPDQQFVIVDCHAGTAELSDGTDVLAGRMFGSVPPRLFELPPGSANLGYTTSSGTPGVWVLWRDATL